MTRLHAGTHTDVTTTLLGRIGRAFTRTQPQPAEAGWVAETNPGSGPALAEEMPDPAITAAYAQLHDSYTKTWGELALAAHGRGEHEGRRYSLVCPACRAQ